MNTTIQKQKQNQPRTNNTVRWVALLAMLLAHAAPASATPSQTPLVNRPEGQPLPNLMLTLDDSGSMMSNYLPEGKFTLNGQSVNFPTDLRIFVHPKEIAKNIWTTNRNTTTSPTVSTSDPYFWDTRFITGVPQELEASELDAKSKLYQYQMRSPQVNVIYYNPAIKYQPWSGVDSTGQPYQFPNADIHNAALDPLALDPKGSSIYPAGWIDSTHKVDLTLVTSYTAYWSRRDEPFYPPYTPTTEYPTGSGHIYQPSLHTFNAALLYLLRPGADPNDTSKYDYWNLNSGASSITYPYAFPARGGLGDCTVTQTGGTASNGLQPGSTVCSQQAELQNFANWFVYYRSRLLIAQGTLPTTLGAMSNQFRAGWGTIHQGITYANGIPSDYLNTSGSYLVDGQPSETVQHGVRDWTGTNKSDYTKWIRTLKTYGGTPTRQSVKAVQNYFKRTDNFSPWSSDMVNGSDISTHLSCRRSYALVLTDGYYTPFAGQPANPPGNRDGNGSQSVDGLDHPFSDTSSNTLADYVMDSWLTDLQPSIADNVQAVSVTPKTSSQNDGLLAKIKSDPATYQHLNYFFMGFAITGKLMSTDVLTNPTSYDNELLRLSNCGQGNGDCWANINPDSATTAPQDLIDDMWHAVINSRGQYFSISNPQDLQNALQTVVQRTSGESFKEGGLATASASLTNGTVAYLPEYTPYSWAGTVRAYGLDTSGNYTKQLWSAEEVLPAPSARQIYTWNGSQAVPLLSGQNFGSGSNSSVLTPKLIDFIRGGSGDPKTMRARNSSHLLPDFIDSVPLYVKDALNMGYTDNGYADYVTQKQARSDGLLFVGGNGGMLHAFSTNTGVEKFAYIPGVVVPNLPLLAQADYGFPSNYHQYFVDGQQVEADVLIGNGTPQWQNIVVGTLGAGGRAVYAIKIDKTDVTNGLNGNAVMWEVTHPDMGYITSTPQVGRLADNSWKIFVGNGVDSASGFVSLLVIDVATGAVQSIHVDDTPPATTGLTAGQAPGMGGVTLAVDAKTGYTSAVYAGDTLGRLWRFDVNTASTPAVAVGYGGQPLFTTSDSDTGGNPQPIMAAPAVFTHPLGGEVVVINTGRLIYDTDSTNTQLQSAYGIWDKIAATKSSISNASPGITRADLAHQAINARYDIPQANGSVRSFFDLTSNTVNWNPSDPTVKAQKGWLLDLAVPDTIGTASSFSYPKAIYDPQALGQSVLVTAITPGSPKASCNASKSAGYGFFIKALTGAQSKIPSVDTDGNGIVNSSDRSYSGFVEEGAQQRIVTTTPETHGSRRSPCSKTGIAKNVAGNQALKDNCSVVTIQDRIWRQLLNPPTP